MPDKERARARFEARAITYGLDIARLGNGHDYDSDETQRYWLGFCWAWPEFKECKMEIDCSKAPEGATHWGSETDCHCESWYEVKDGAIVRFLPADEAAQPMRYAEHGPAYYHSVSDLVSLPDAWTGEGLPPVGTVCEALIPHHPEPLWVEVTVLAHWTSPQGLIYSRVAERDTFYPPGEFRFRPIRTPEQIAAEEREKAIKDIDSIMRSQIAGRLPTSVDMAAALYDAGYRKQA